MLDSIEFLTGPTLGMRLWCFFLVVITIAVSWNRNYNFIPQQSAYRLRGASTTFLFCCFFLLAITYWIDSDTYQYIDLAKSHDVDFKFQDGLRMEKGHQFICSIVDGDWLGFRILCWGGALCLFVLTAKRLGINIQHALFCLFLLWYHTFCYGRVTLAMAVYFFGVSFLCKPLNARYISCILGLLIISSSLYFHRSAVLLIAVTPAIYMLTLKRKVSVGYLLLCLTVIFLVIYTNMAIFYQSTVADEDTMQHLQNYSEKELEVRNLFGVISMYISFCAKYIPIIMISYVLVKKKKENICKPIVMLFSVMIVLLTISLSFYFSGEAQYTLFYRALNFTMIPVSLILAYMHFNGLMSKRLFFYSIAFGIFEAFWKVFYSVYSMS